MPPPQTAIAGAVDLRCYCTVESRQDGQIRLNLPDLAFDKTWEISELPWDTMVVSTKAPRSDSTPDAMLLSLFASKYVQGVSSTALQAAQTFLYLYMHLSEHKRYAALLLP